MDRTPDRTFTIAPPGLNDLSIIFETEEEESRNCTMVINDEDNSNTGGEGDEYVEERNSKGCNDEVKVCDGESENNVYGTPKRSSLISGNHNFEAMGEGVDVTNPNSRDSCEVSNGSASLEELYENGKFNNDSCSEVEAGSDIYEANEPGTQKTEENDYSDEEASSVYSESYLGRTDIFRPMLTDEQRKMLGLGSIPDLTKRKASMVLENPTNSHFSSSSGTYTALGGGDADYFPSKQNITDECTSKMKSLRLRIGAASDTESMEPPDVDGRNVKRFTPNGAGQPKQKRVSFSDCEDPMKSHQRRNPSGGSGRSFCRYVFPHKSKQDDNAAHRMFRNSSTPFQSKSSVLHKKHKAFVKAGTYAYGPEAKTNTPKTPTPSGDLLSNKEADHPIFRTNQVLQRLTTLSAGSLKSKKLETKMQQKIRGALFDYESKWSAQDLKFRRKLQALELEYQNKFLSLLEIHNASQRKLYEKFNKRIQKTEKEVKREALQGHLNEGNCFHISHNICSIKMEEEI